jgi:hypothetical protein
VGDAWAFGTNQLLTVLGLLLTLGIALAGFRTFGRWRKEKLEEKRIDIAIETLALTYKSKFIFDHIRSALSYPQEWEEMAKWPGDTDQLRHARGPFYAVLKRINANKEFFDRAWEIQVQCSAIFGPQVEDIFLLLHKARREVEVSAEMLLQDPHPSVRSEDNIRTWEKFRADVWEAYGVRVEGGDPIGKRLSEFREGIEGLCRPIIDRQYGMIRWTKKAPAPNVRRAQKALRERDSLN